MKLDGWIIAPMKVREILFQTAILAAFFFAISKFVPELHSIRENYFTIRSVVVPTSLFIAYKTLVCLYWKKVRLVDIGEVLIFVAIFSVHRDILNYI